MALQKIELNPETTPTHSIIILHGLGADGNDFLPVAEQLQRQLPSPTRFVLPHAKKWPITINVGMTMPAWYDMKSLDHPRDIGWESFNDSVAEINNLIENEINNGIEPEKIILAGFSQGGVMALYTAKYYNQRLGGIIALSTYFIENPTSNNNNVMHPYPIFMGHGISDPIIPLEIGKQSADTLKNFGHTLTWKEYPMPHSVCTDEINDILKWLISTYYL